MKKEAIEKLEIEYYDAEAGWINIRLKAGNKIYEERMSHVFDPLPDLKCWLEAIVIGVEQTSFTFDNEGNVIKFDAQRKWINREKKYAPSALVVAIVPVTISFVSSMAVCKKSQSAASAVSTNTFVTRLNESSLSQVSVTLIE